MITFTNICLYMNNIFVSTVDVINVTNASRSVLWFGDEIRGRTRDSPSRIISFLQRAQKSVLQFLLRRFLFGLYRFVLCGWKTENPIPRRFLIVILWL
jgi:hypothetical protein